MIEDKAKRAFEVDCAADLAPIRKRKKFYELASDILFLSLCLLVLVSLVKSFNPLTFFLVCLLGIVCTLAPFLYTKKEKKLFEAYKKQFFPEQDRG